LTPLEKQLGEALENLTGFAEFMPSGKKPYRQDCECRSCKVIREALAAYRDAKEKDAARDKRLADAAEAASKDPVYLATLIDQGAEKP
jgi:hypothetical protein